MKKHSVYQLDVVQYKKLLTENITKSYKKANANSKKVIDLEAKAIADDLDITERVQCLAEKDAFITLKDHKTNFLNNPTCRLINPAKESA